MKQEDGMQHHKEKHTEDFNQKKKQEKQKQMKL